MAIVTDISGQSSPNVGSSGSLPLPMPVILGLVGGGIGLLVFLNRKASVGSAPGGKTLLPNTAIMLGSLQEGLLNLQGQVGQNQADISSQLTGVGENLGSQIDAQTGQLQQGFTGIGQQITDANGQLVSAINGVGTQVTQIGKGQDALTTAIGSSASNQQASYSQLLGLYKSLLTLVHGQNNQLPASSNGAGPASNMPILGQIGAATQELSSGPNTVPRILSGNRGFTFNLSPDQSKININWQNLQDQTGSWFQLQEDKDLFANSFAGSKILSGTSGTAVLDLGGYRLDPNKSYRLVQVQPSQGGAGNHLSFLGNQLTGGMAPPPISSADTFGNKVVNGHVWTTNTNGELVNDLGPA